MFPGSEKTDKVTLHAADDGDFTKKLFLNMPMGYFRLNIVTSPEGLVCDYQYLDVNEKFLEIMGRRREDFVGRMHTEIGPIFVNKLDLQILGDVAYRGRVYESKANRFRSNDRYYDTTIYSPQYGDVVALFTDVTEAVIATQELEKRERELTRVYTNIPVGIEVYDKDGVMVEVNDQDALIVGVPGRDALLGQSLFEHPSLPAFAAAMLREGKDVTFDVNIDSMKINRLYYGANRLYYGEEAEEVDLRYLTIKCTVLHDAEGNIENYLVIVIDNTELYQTSARLQEFETAFNSVAEIAEVGFFRWNPLKGEYMNSDQWYRNMGFMPDEGRSLAFDAYRHLIHPDDLAELEGFLAAAATGTHVSYTGEFRVSNGLGGWKWLRTATRVTECDIANNIVTIIGINYNINEIKLSEQRLIEAKHKAEESDRLKSAFIANMSHEIRTPLNAIVGFSQILADTEDAEEKQQYVSIIQENNENLLSLISEIIDISKVESEDSAELVYTDILLADLCRQTVASLQSKVPDGVTLDYTGTPSYDAFIVVSDVNMLTQILLNLLSNALKFTYSGYVRLSFELKDNEVLFCVEDTGVGLEPGQADTIFERFVKFNDFVPGAGLGLAISKEMVSRLGGTIGALSEGKDRGARFWFAIPLKPTI